MILMYRVSVIILFLVLLSPMAGHFSGNENSREDQAWADSSNTNPSQFPPMFGTSFGGPSGQGDQAIQKDPILKYPSQGHVYVTDLAQCQSFAYSSDPPNSGAMTHDWMAKEELPFEQVPSCTIVHVLSKGNIILFVDPKRLSSDTMEAVEQLKGPTKKPDVFLSQEHIGYSVLVITTQRFKDPILIAAWRRLLPLSQWDQIVVNSFVSGHLGNPHRGE